MTILTTHKGITYTGGKSASLPLLLHGAGVPGVNHRWVAKVHEVGALTTATDQVGSLPLAGSATVVDAAGQRFFRFDGISQVLSAAGVSDVGTVTVVARVQAANGTSQGILNGAAVKISRTVGSTDASPVVMATIGGGTNLYHAVQTNGPSFHVLTIARGASTTAFAADTVTGSQSSGAAPITRLDIGAMNVGADYGQIDVLEVITWPTALTIPQTQQVYAALKTHYGNALA